MENFKTILQDKTTEVENIILSYLPKVETEQHLIMEAMNYSVEAGGKRLRPLLMLEVAKSFGASEKEVYPFMAVIEFIHTYSLVHDDLPAMDNDDYRRGKQTTHKKYGEAIGVLAGDALLNYAFEVGIKAAEGFDDKEKAIKALKVMFIKSGIYGMIGGQTVDVLNENKQKTKSELDYINQLKTGALMQAAMMVGAIIAGVSEEDVNTIGEAALDIGLAFQIQDDILDITSTTEELGKPVHSDEKNNKSTYVNLMGVESAKDEVKRLSDNAISKIKSTQIDNEFLYELIIYLTNRTK